VLRACRRLLRPGGRTAFLVIHVAPGLSPSDRRRAVLTGPRAVDSRRQPAELAVQAGFVEVEEIDVSAEYLQTARGWFEHSWRFADELRQVLGPLEFEQKQSERRAAIQAIEEGALRRALVVGRRPG
jgi:hypothetical protein